jgi:hypothetical protein
LCPPYDFSAKILPEQVTISAFSPSPAVRHASVRLPPRYKTVVVQLHQDCLVRPF